LQLTVDTYRNRRCMEEGMLHGLRTRAAGSDAKITASLEPWESPRAYGQIPSN